MRKTSSWIVTGVLFVGLLAAIPPATQATSRDATTISTSSSPAHQIKVSTSTASSSRSTVLTATPAVPIVGEQVTLSGTYPTKIARPVTIQYRSGKAWKTLKATKTTAKGHFAVTYTQKSKSVTYRAVAKAVRIRSTSYPKLTTSGRTVRTSAQTLKLSIPSSATVGQKVSATITTTPGRAGRKLHLQIKKTAWTTIATAVTSKTGKASIKITAPKTTGTNRYRAVADKYHGAPALTTAQHSLSTKPASSFVNIPDQFLLSCIDDSLGLRIGTKVTKKQATKVSSIMCEVSGYDVKNLKGLEAFTNLKSLILTGNSISDVKPMAGLTKLTELRLGANDISNIQPLTKLTNIKVLDLFANKIIDVQPLATLTKLTNLDLSYNKISDIKPLAKLTKTSINLEGNPVCKKAPKTKGC